MTNDNSNERENEMTLEFDNVEVTNEELEAAGEFYDSLDLEIDNEEFEDFCPSEMSFDEMLDFESSHDAARDLDFYGYGE